MERTDWRDVLANRIEKWANTEDWHVYDYVDILLADLDEAGFQIMAKGTVGDEGTAPDFVEAGDPDRDALASWIHERLDAYREYDARDGQTRLYMPASVVNALGPDLFNVINALGPDLLNPWKR